MTTQTTTNTATTTEISQFVPSWVLNPQTPEIASWQEAMYRRLVLFLGKSLNATLRAKGASGKTHVPLEEVLKIYAHMAGKYRWAHHLTTACHDREWRAEVAEALLESVTDVKSPLILDLFAGTGLSARAILKQALQKGQNQGRLLSIDASAEMLEQGQRLLRKVAKRNWQLETLCVDIANTGLVNNSADAAGLMCGIGAVSHENAGRVYQEILRVLKPGAVLAMVDMHRPDPAQPGRVILPGFHSHGLEVVAWEQATLPLALVELWGWGDPTLAHYILGLAVFQDETENFWGFDIETREFRVQSWWLGLPVVPTMKQVGRKVRISQEEAAKRTRVLQSVLLAVKRE